MKSKHYSAVILDLGLPDGNGLNVVRALRANKSSVPVLILTARDGVYDRVTGLRAGADDYLVKPFAMEELIARLEALMRRPGELLGRSLELGNLTFDTAARQLFAAGEPCQVSARELAVLEILLRRRGRVVSKICLRGPDFRPVVRCRIECGRGLRPPLAQDAAGPRRHS